MTDSRSNLEILFMNIVHYIHRIIVLIARYVFSLLYDGSKQSVSRVTNPLLLESVTSLAEKIRTRKITSEELVQAYIARIKEISPVVNCLGENRFEDALKEAKQADQLIASGKKTVEQLEKEKPLLGVPFTTKASMGLKGLPHTCGLYIRKNIIAKEDADIIKFSRNAGAIPLGLTNVPELCMWWESHNRLYGRTKNPYNTSRIVGGSSGGEGCLQASVGSAFGIGSDIGGSIRMPAFFNGIFGHKPSKFIVSLKGEFPSSDSIFQASFLGLGPMTRYASDLKPLLKILASDNAPKLKLDEKVDMKNVKVYYQRKILNHPLVCDVEPAIDEAMMNAVNHLTKVCKIKPKELALKKLDRSSEIWMSNMKVKDAPTYAYNITGSNSWLNIFKEIGKSVFGLSKNTFIALVSSIVDEGGNRPGSPKYYYFLELRQKLEDELKDIVKDDGVFLLPTHPTAAPYHNEPILRTLNFCYTSIINVLGFPATHVPMGLNEEGLPIGIQVVANTNNDRLCLAVAEELEKAFGGWVEPGNVKKDK